MCNIERSFKIVFFISLAVWITVFIHPIIVPAFFVGVLLRRMRMRATHAVRSLTVTKGN